MPVKPSFLKNADEGTGTQMELSRLTTEQRNQNSMNLDQMSTAEVLKTINEEDKKVAFAVEEVLPKIEIAVEHIVTSLAHGGRLFYVGAGTSGRLGVIDASECPPTFMTPKEMVQTVMAGGEDAFFNAAEGAEDSEKQAEVDLKGERLYKAGCRHWHYSKWEDTVSDWCVKVCAKQLEHIRFLYPVTRFVD